VKPKYELSINEEKENGSMIEIEGEWSSIRPVPGTNPADMRRNGVFKIDEYDPETGRVAGTYYDLEEYYNERFTGTITPANNSYHFSLEHRDPYTYCTRKLEGNFIAELNEISIVAGVWEDQCEGDERAAKHARLRDQNEGVWVATKP
jgi:hypothetical protein